MTFDSLLSNPHLQSFQTVAPRKDFNLADFKLSDGTPMIGSDSLLIPGARDFTTILNSGTRVYSYRFDEAMRDNMVAARAMRRDAFIRGLLEERILPTINRKWQIEVPDSADPDQRFVQDELTKIVDAIPDFDVYKRALLDGVWYGRAGVQQSYARDHRLGDQWGVSKWEPIHGDSVQFTFDGVPAILMDAMTAGWYSARGATRGPWGDIRGTDRGGMALVLNRPYWRDRFVIHQHIREKADFFEGELAGSVQGLGLRGLVYWQYVVRTEALTWMLAYMQSVGQMDMLIFNYPWANDAAKKQQEANANKVIGKAAIVCPRNPAGNWPAVEQLSMNDAGLKALHDLVAEYFDRHIERLIVGQSMSAGLGGPGGLEGDGRADFARATKDEILIYDTNRLDTVLTRDLLKPLIRYNYKWAKFSCKFKSVLPNLEGPQKVEAGSQLIVSGISVKVDEMREAAGFSRPEEGDEIVGGMPPMPPGGMPGDPNALPPDGGGGMPPGGDPAMGALPPAGPVEFPGGGPPMPFSGGGGMMRYGQRADTYGMGKQPTRYGQADIRGLMRFVAANPHDLAARGALADAFQEIGHGDDESLAALRDHPGPAWVAYHPETGRVAAGRLWTMPEIRQHIVTKHPFSASPWTTRAGHPDGPYSGPGGVHLVVPADDGSGYEVHLFNPHPRSDQYTLESPSQHGNESILYPTARHAQAAAQAFAGEWPELPPAEPQVYDAGPPPAASPVMGYPGGGNTYIPRWGGGRKPKRNDAIGFTRYDADEATANGLLREVAAGPEHLQVGSSARLVAADAQDELGNHHHAAQLRSDLPMAGYQHDNGQNLYVRTGPGHFSLGTPPEVIKALTSALYLGNQVHVANGDTKTGRDELNEHGNTGRVAIARGEYNYPIIMGRGQQGEWIHTPSVVRIRDLVNGFDQYRHPEYNHGTITLHHAPADTWGGTVPPNIAAQQPYTIHRDGQPHARFRTERAARMWAKRLGLTVTPTPPQQFARPTAPIPYGDGPHKFCCAYVELAGEAAIRLRGMARLIPDDLLCESEGGREDRPHVTILYGLHDGTAESVRRVVAATGPIKLKLGRVSVFPGGEGKDFDVVKVDVDSPDLRRLNYRLKALPHTETHKGYKPHATLAYVKKGQGAKAAAMFRPLDLGFTAAEIVLSNTDGGKAVIPTAGPVPYRRQGVRR